MTDIRPATPADWPGLWGIFRAVVATGDTYPYGPDTTEEEAKALWIDAPQATYVAVEDGRVIGTYTLKPNQPALGAHVCNAGYMVSPDARRKGIGRALCVHSLDEARKFGFRSMQYNLVVSTNKGAIRLWTEMGFETIGTVPGAFNHATEGYVDALIMVRTL
jgi:L-amino acid N-acyltransferase YncA